MNSKVKGLIVEIGGDTSGLQKALSSVESKTKSLQTELRGINTLLKFDPKNSELLSQKQKVLSEAIKETKNQLSKLREAQDQYVRSGGDLNSDKYRSLQREIINTEQKLKNLKYEASNWSTISNKLDEISKKTKAWGDNLTKIGTTLTASITAPITALMTAGVKYNAQIEKYQTALTTLTGSSKEAAKIIDQIKKDAAKTPFDVKGLTQANQLLISTGLKGEDARKTILALGNAISATGGGNDELSRMAVNLQQIRNAGKATALDIRQFAYAGIDVYGLLADYLGVTKKEASEMTITFEDLNGALIAASEEGGKYFQAMEKQSETFNGKLSNLKDTFDSFTGKLAESLMPVLQDAMDGLNNLMTEFQKLAPEQQKTITNFALIAAAIGPVVIILGKLINAISTIAGAISKVTKFFGNIAAGASGASVALGFVNAGLTAIGLGFAEQISRENALKNGLAGVAAGFGKLAESVNVANSKLTDFDGIFSGENLELSNIAARMQEIQGKITEIYQLASDERRNLTQEEINTINEYFRQLDELSSRQLDIERAKADSLKTIYDAELNNFSGTNAEYEALGEEALSTMLDQTQREQDLIKKNTAEKIEIKNLEIQNMGELNAEQQAEYDKFIADTLAEQKRQIDESNKNLGNLYATYSKHYGDMNNSNNGFLEKVKEFNRNNEKDQKYHEEQIKKIKNDELWYVTDKLQAINNETFAANDTRKRAMTDLLKNMDANQQKELAHWIESLATVEMYGGKIDDEQKKIAKQFLEAYASLPPETKKVFNNTMEGALDGINQKAPSLFERAANIADSIISTFNRAFDIHSPSKVMRRMFENVMLGGIEGIEDEQKAMEKAVQDVANNVTDTFGSVKAFDMNYNLSGELSKAGGLGGNITLQFYPQEMTEAELDKAFNYVNRRFGVAY